MCRNYSFGINCVVLYRHVNLVIATTILCDIYTLLNGICQYSATLFNAHMLSNPINSTTDTYTNIHRIVLLETYVVKLSSVFPQLVYFWKYNSKLNSQRMVVGRYYVQYMVWPIQSHYCAICSIECIFHGPQWHHYPRCARARFCMCWWAHTCDFVIASTNDGA